MRLSVDKVIDPNNSQITLQPRIPSGVQGGCNARGGALVKVISIWCETTDSGSCVMLCQSKSLSTSAELVEEAAIIVEIRAMMEIKNGSPNGMT